MNEDIPNWESYRISKGFMESILSQSTDFRYTCSRTGVFQGVNNYTDYVRLSFQTMSLMNFFGFGDCKTVEYLNIR